MEEIRRIINKEEYYDFQELIKNFCDITTEQTKQTKKIINYISLFDDLKQNKKTKSTIVDNNIKKAEKMLGNEEQRELLKLCIEYCYDSPRFSLKQIYNMYSHLSIVTNAPKIEDIDDIFVVLEYCYKLRNGVFSADLSKKLADNYIAAVLEYILDKKESMKSGVDNVCFMHKSFEKIAKNIAKGNKIVIKDEERFYELLKKHYYAQSYDEETKESVRDEGYDLVKLIRDFVKSYNDTIEYNNDPTMIVIDDFTKYISETPVKDLSYSKFPSYDNANFIKIIHDVRKKLIDSEITDDFVEKLAILDMYHASYYKQLNYVDDTKTNIKTKKVSK